MTTPASPDALSVSRLDATPALLSCPFCGADQSSGFIEIMNENEGVGNENGGEATPYYRVVCQGCNGLTEGARLEADAIAAWNHRSVPASAPKAGSETPEPDPQRIAAIEARMTALGHDGWRIPSALGGHTLSGTAHDLLYADLPYLLAERSSLLERQRDGERFTQNAVMEAIELTIRVCDHHEDEDVPREARCVDYAGIFASALAKASASRSSTPVAAPAASTEP